jgi:uracil-DNA glycosylase
MDTPAIEFLPEVRSLPALRQAVQGCRGCSLYQHPIQAVFGEGGADSHLMLVGEQPGDMEDRAGRPFVGPAGRLLDDVLDAVGIPRQDVYVTNAVKHFKFKKRGKRRIHDKPTHYEMRACRPWLEAEIAAVRPQVLVLLGATAAQSLLGREFRVTQHRGEAMTSPLARWTFATVHPASLLRIPDSEQRRVARAQFVDEFAYIAEHYHQAVARSSAPLRAP